MDPRKFDIDVSTMSAGSRPTLLYNGQPVTPPDAVMPLIGAVCSPHDLALLRQLSALGVRTLNSAAALEASRDKLVCGQLLAAHGLPVPRTLLPRVPVDPAVVKRAFGCFPSPVIAKLTSGSKGDAVWKLESEDELRKLLDTLGVPAASSSAAPAFDANTDKSAATDKPASADSASKATDSAAPTAAGAEAKDKDKEKALSKEALKGSGSLIFQEFIATSSGRDVRVFVAGGRVVAAMMRVAASGFKANVHKGLELSRVLQICRISSLADRRLGAQVHAESRGGAAGAKRGAAVRARHRRRRPAANGRQGQARRGADR